MTSAQRFAQRHQRTALAAAIIASVALPAAATNGMNLDAYGAKAGGMGGASFAHENGNSAIMNNPATLGLRKEGHSFGLGLTLLQPDVKTITPMGSTAESDGDQYWMPSISYIRKSGQFTYGVGMFAQGGMGTEYGSSLSGSPTMPFRSEVGFGRLMFPLAFNVNPNLIVAGQIDYVWAGMDVQMSPDGMNYVSFSNNNDFTGAAKGNGWAFKLGAHYKVSDTFSVGATYHSKTDISDLEGSGTLNGNPAQFKVIDFQWPETYGVGLAWQATPEFMLATDVKFIGWKDSLKDFRLAATVGGMSMAFPPLPQNWKDQTVIMIGGQYMLRPGLALRAGYNYARNPVPDSTLNPLFPATIESHYTFGVGWSIGGGHSVAGSVAIAPKVTRTNPNMFPNPSSPGSFLPGTVSHSQTTLRFNYNYSF